MTTKRCGYLLIYSYFLPFLLLCVRSNPSKCCRQQRAPITATERTSSPASAARPNKCMTATDARVGPRSPPTETLPEGWKSAFDPGYNRKYYFDRHGTVQWELPTAPVLHEELSPVTPGRAQERGPSMQQAAGSTEVAGARSPVSGPQSRAADVPVLPTPLPRSRLADVPVFPTRVTERRRANSGVTQVFTNAHLADADLAAKRIQEIFQRKHRSRVQRLKTAGAQRAREVRDAVRMQLAERQARLAERQVSQSDSSPEATPST